MSSQRGSRAESDMWRERRENVGLLLPAAALVLVVVAVVVVVVVVVDDGSALADFGVVG